MITGIKHNNITWINLTSPSVKEVDDVAKEYPVHPLIAEELTSMTMRPKSDLYPENLYLILHFPSLSSSSCTTGGSEIDFVIGSNFLITTHYGEFPQFENFFRNAKNQKGLKEENFQSHAGFLAFRILKELYGISLRQLDKTQLKLNKIEERIFLGEEKQIVKELSILKRSLLNFKRNLQPHGAVLESFEQNARQFFGKDFEHYLTFLNGEYLKIKNLADNMSEMLDSLYMTNESFLSIKTNEVMKVLTIMAFITFPLMLLSSIFGMNTIDTPILGIKGDFWIITAIMVIATFGMFLFFKNKKWL